MKNGGSSITPCGYFSSTGTGKSESSGAKYWEVLEENLWKGKKNQINAKPPQVLVVMYVLIFASTRSFDGRMLNVAVSHAGHIK